MASSTLAHRELVRLQPLATAPATVNEQARTVELGIASVADVGGVVLDCNPGAVSSAAVVNVLLDHRNETSAIAGRLLSLRAEKGQLIGLAQFTDAPAADVGWQLASRGCPTSVRAQFSPDDIEPGRNGAPDVVRRWRLAEVSLVAVGADLTTTRSAATAADMTTTNKEIIVTQSINEQTTDLENTPRERRRVTDIMDACRKAGLDGDFAEKLITDGTLIDQARASIIDAMADRQKSQPQTLHGRVDVGQGFGAQTTLQRGIKAALEQGEPLDLPELLRYEGVRGRTPLERVQNAMLQRGMTSTTDLPALLLGGMEGRMLQRFTMQQGGILEAASIETIADFRPFNVLDSGLVGVAKKLKEGGEIPYTAINESSKTAKAGRVALAVGISVEALANDARGGLMQAVDELGMAPLDAEKVDLVYEIEGTANGGTCADGQALFHNSHANSVNAGPIGIDKLGAAIALLRGQKSIGGRYIDQKPATIICGTAAELTIRQLLSDTLVANEPQNVNPWRDLQIEVEPRLGDTYCYLLSAGPRRPLELGRLYAAPRLSSTVDFETSAYKVKAEHAYSVAVTEFRAIVRVKLSA